MLVQRISLNGKSVKAQNSRGYYSLKSLKLHRVGWSILSKNWHPKTESFGGLVVTASIDWIAHRVLYQAILHLKSNA